MRKFIKIAAAGVIAVIFLSIFCIFYRYSGIRRDNPYEDTDYCWFPHQLQSTLLEGFSYQIMDENGFNNSYLYDEGMDVLLMGASDMEAINIRPDRDIAALLNNRGLKTYNVSISGHTIYTRIKNLQAANDRYHPKRILLQLDDISFDIKSMNKAIDGTLEELPARDSGLKFYLQCIPCVKNIYNGLNAWHSRTCEKYSNYLQPREEPGNDHSGEWDRNTYEKTLRAFLEFSKESTQSELVFVYMPNDPVGTDGRYIQKTKLETEKYHIFTSMCRDMNIGFIDVGPGFKKLYNDENVFAFGFANTLPGQGHLNEFGHRVAADEIEAYILARGDAE